MARQTFEGFPRGWFMVAFSDELGPGGVLKLNYFGQAQVVFRGEDGVVRVMDGFCPHLGAHLGAGGKVLGNSIQCPFHHWVFDGDSGQCTSIPYCDQGAPKRARLTKWTSVERNGMVFLWFDPAGGEPAFDVPYLPVHESDEWMPWKHSVMRIKTHSREIVENVVDVGHFAPVHGTHVEKFENEFVDEKAIQRSGGIAYPRGGGKDRFTIEATYYGPGYQISDMHGYLPCMLVNAHTMIDEGTLDLRFGVALRRGEDPALVERMAQAYIDNLTTGFLEDVQIWENKCFREVPLLCATDGPIMKLRKWYSQFYPATEAAAE
ncbi:MAG: aromatic ring-hydroxylating dioxygenase subunit alpha [Myxococcales bacterium]|nr:aromatic ring-hydroxylating dioxygenase subunit alpha [Myxococcales bacterium]MCB9530697.1 aromatic ring-hydroxylating dioxygenase subunit alpha [Myxococcales bacterium]